jgi:hypothetical protein
VLAGRSRIQQTAINAWLAVAPGLLMQRIKRGGSAPSRGCSKQPCERPRKLGGCLPKECEPGGQSGFDTRAEAQRQKILSPAAQGGRSYRRS